MNRLLCSALGLLLFGSVAQAQFGSGRPGGGGGSGASLGSPGLGGGIGNSLGSPSFSPYLNIARGGNSAAQNYYGIVRPQQNFAGALQNLQSQVTGGQNAGDDALAQGVTVGTRVRFLNTGGYFQNMNGGTTSSTPLGNSGGAGLMGNNRPNANTLGGLGNGNLRGGFGNQSGGFGTSGTGGTRGPRN